MRIKALISLLSITAGLYTASGAAHAQEQEIKLMNSDTTCNASAEGAIRYISSTDIFESCDGSAWASFGAGSALPSGTNGQTLQHDGSNWVASTVSQTASTMHAGWPDAIKCSNATVKRILVLVHETSSVVVYRYPQNAGVTNEFSVSFTPGTGVYSGQTNMADYNCVTNSWSIADLYTQGRAFNLVGGNGLNVSLTTLADVSATTPTDGQVLAWNNANTRWEASAAPSSLPAGTNGQTLQHDGSNWVASTVSQTANTMQAGWPDAIMCDDGNEKRLLRLRHVHYGSSIAQYADEVDSLAQRFIIRYNTTDGSYLDNTSHGSYDCVTNSWSIADLYTQGRAFNLVGGNGLNVSLTTLADVSGTTPTDGQVLSWNDSVKSWQATAAASGLPSGTNGQTLQHDGSNWVATSNNQTASTTRAGWPDAIICKTGSGNSNMLFLRNQESGNTQYADPADSESIRYIIQYSTSTGAYVSNNKFSSYDCVTNAWSIADLYTQGRAFNLVGGNGNDISLTTLADVSATAPTDGQVLAWNNANSRWEASAAPSSLPSGTNGQTLQHDGSNWVASTINQNANTVSAGWPDAVQCSSGTTSFTMYRGVQTATHTEYDMPLAAPGTVYRVKFDAAGAYESHNNLGAGWDCVDNTWSITDMYTQGKAFNFVGGNGVDTSLTTLADVSATAPTDGQVLAWSSANSRWEAAAAASGLPSGTNGQLLQHDGSNWVAASNNQSASTIVSGWPDTIVCNVTSPDYGPLILRLVYAPLSAGNAYAPGKYVYRAYTGTYADAIFNSDGSFNKYNDITASDCNTTIAQLYTEGRAYNFVGGNGSDISLTTLADVSATAPTDGQILAWNDSVKSWQPAAAASGLPSGTNGQLLQHDGSNWVATSNNQSSSSMVTGWPDAIKCEHGGAAVYPAWTLTIRYVDAATDEVVYADQSGTSFLIKYVYTTGAYKSQSGFGGGSPIADCVNKSISQMYTDGQAFNFVGGNGSDISLTTLADVSNTTPTDGQVLSWNDSVKSWQPAATASGLPSGTNGQLLQHDGSNWVATSNNQSASTMVAGWPDTIQCVDAGRTTIFLLGQAPYSDGTYIYYNQDGTHKAIHFASSGAYSTHTGSGGADCVTNTWSITDLYTQNRAWNLVGSQGGSGNASMITNWPDAIRCGDTTLYQQRETATHVSYAGQHAAFDNRNLIHFTTSNDTISVVTNETGYSMTGCTVGVTLSTLEAAGSTFKFLSNDNNSACPTGFTEIENQGCIQNTAQGTGTTCPAAVSYCYTNFKGRLPSYSEQVIGRSLAGYSRSTWEWLDTGYFFHNTSGFESCAVIGTSDNPSGGSHTNTNYAFRCFIPK